MGDYKKTLKIINSKKSRIARFEKHNIPKERSSGLGQVVCRRCGKKGVGIINKYGLLYCRRCFREIAKDLGFKKYN